MKEQQRKPRLADTSWSALLKAKGIRFTMVGGSCAILHNLIMFAGDLNGLHYAVSSLISFAVVTTIGFSLHSAFTFRGTAQDSSFIRYALAMAANYPLSIAALFVLIDLIGFPVWIAAPVSTVLLFVWNFTMSRWAIVRGIAS